MEQPTFSLARLLPDFSTLTNGQIDTAAGMSATIVAFLLVVASSFFLFALVKFFQAKGQVRFYFNLIESVDQKDLAHRRRDITLQALKHKGYGRLWKEFDESLVDSMDGGRLFNTLDAAHFFNTHTLARGLTENRLLAAVPGFLTAIGVLGTFAGLQMGLSVLELNKDAGVEVLQDGIGGMISGAAIAFLTSVWGVGCSLVFNFLEKLLERGVRSDIGELQNTVDYLYPRINAEQSLVSISEYSKSSSDTLKGLAEKIGDRMQEALKEASGEIRSGLEDSLNQIMAPAIKSLVDGAQASTQTLLDEVMNKFMDGVGNAGEQQKVMMEAATRDVNAAVTKLGTEMTGLVNYLQRQHEVSEQRESERSAAFEQQLNDAVKGSREISAEMQAMLKSQLEEQQKKDELRQKEFVEQLGASVQSGRQVAAEMQAMLRSQLEEQQKKDELRQKAFLEQLGASVHSGRQVAEEMQAILRSQLDEQQKKDDLRQKEFVDQLGASVQSSRRVADEMQAQLATQLNAQRHAESERQAAFKQELELSINSARDVSNQMRDEMMRHTEEQRALDLARQEALHKGLSSLQEHGAELARYVEKLFEKQEQSFRAISDKVVELESKLSRLSDANERAATQMQGAANQLGILSANTKEAAEALGQEVAAAAETSKQVTQDNQRVAELNQELLGSFEQLRSQLGVVSEQVNQAASHAQNGFEAMEQQMRNFVTALGEEVETLEGKVASLMEQYASKVNSQTADRLDVWNKHTAVYISDMTRAVQAISNVLDEIEGKVRVSA